MAILQLYNVYVNYKNMHHKLLTNGKNADKMQILAIVIVDLKTKEKSFFNSIFIHFALKFYKKGGKRMKKAKLKSIALLITLLMLLAIFSMPVMAERTINTDDKIILKKSETDYLIYYKELCDEEFEFALSSSQSTDVSTLTF